MAIYLKTVGGVAAAHKMISRAIPTAIRASLHEAPLPFSLPDTVAESRQRTFDALQVMNALLSSCLGIPRQTKTTVSAGLNRLLLLKDNSRDAPRVLVASEAHAILVEHLGLFVESTYFAASSLKTEGSYLVAREQIHQIISDLGVWNQRFLQSQADHYATGER